MQDKYNIGVLTVNIECMWLGTKWMERFAKVRLSLVSKPHHINSIFTVNTPIMYISTFSLHCLKVYICINLSEKEAKFFCCFLLHNDVMFVKMYISGAMSVSREIFSCYIDGTTYVVNNLGKAY